MTLTSHMRAGARWRPGGFREVYRDLCDEMKTAPVAATESWQGVDVRGRPDAVTRELINVCFEVNLRGIENLDHWRRDAGPNLPWADDHFEERVGGSPLNPGREWHNWPWAASADAFREGGIFNHTYMERLWPKWPRRGNGGDYSGSSQVRGEIRKRPQTTDVGMKGIGWTYGDLESLIDLLAAQPHTRQAWIPLFFPEDTGTSDGGRKPCTLGYQFLVRDRKINVFYPLRSCDLRRHFRDDCYLAVRLLLWVLDRCRERGDRELWRGVAPGTCAVWATSLHVFANDHRMLVAGEPWDPGK